jgi:RimJ/RimL family protein N-acetyltransferase
MAEDVLLFQIVDKQNRLIRVVSCDESNKPEIVRFYERFEPKGDFQGIPPVPDEARIVWLDQLLSEWQNFIIQNGETIIGHIAVDCKENPISPELIIFIDQAYRCQGIGTLVLVELKDLLGSLKCGEVWVTVKNNNRPAVMCFLKVGFEFDGPIDMEREMICPICEKPSR